MATAVRLPWIGTAADLRARRTITTPENVVLPVELASRGERAAAFLLDLAFMLVAVFVLFLGVFGIVAATPFDNDSWSIIFLLLAWFLLRNFYFTFFELAWNGATPGKRIFGIRVIDRGGGALRGEAVFARNLTREVEVFLPASLLLAGSSAGIDPWIALAMVGWMSVLMFMPLFNRDRLRIGDMIGGTWVVTAPKVILLPDMAQAEAAAAPASGVPGETIPAAPPAAPRAPRYRFQARQLAIYGIDELQALEHVLRQEGPNAAAMRDEVSRRIRRKIDWADDGAAVEPAAFLQAFYVALRAHLEARLLLGKRRRNKHDTA